MDAFAALLRAVNVGGTGRLTMDQLRGAAVSAGFASVRTLGASGNVVFRAAGDEDAVRASLAGHLQAATGRTFDLLVRGRAELAEVLARNPFADRDPARVLVLFLPGAPPADPLAGSAGLADELVRSGRRELFVFYPSGQGASRLRLPVERRGTARNMNTVAKLAALAGT